MICCLVFFLITITCRGDFTIRLMYILGLYTFASVMVARIAIEQSRTISMLYTSVLGIATLFVVMQFVQFSGVFALLSLPLTIGFLVLIGFLADRITFDCTLIDESEDSSGVGLLQSLGLIRNPAESMPVTNKQGKLALKKIPSSSKTTNRKRQHNPGVWVLYFALFAIPLFGLGQLTISEPEGHRTAYWLLFGYLLFSLCLLVLTSFLGLRRYLRQRHLEMPFSLNTVWMGGGILGVCIVLSLISLLPLPGGSLGIFDLPIRIETASARQANRFGSGEEGTEKDVPDSAKTSNDKAKSKEKSSKPSQNKMKAQDEKGSNKSDPQKSKDPVSKEKSESSPTSSSQPPWSVSLSGGFSNLVRWIISGLLLLVILFLIMRFRDELIAAFRDIVAWWSGLFGHSSEASSTSDTSSSSTMLKPVVTQSFNDFVNPFGSNVAGWKASRIIRHSFEAIEVWGRERQLARSDQETPEEYIRRLTANYPDQSESLFRLMQLYNRLAYANGKVDTSEVKKLDRLWKWLSTS